MHTRTDLEAQFSVLPGAIFGGTYWTLEQHLFGLPQFQARLPEEKTTSQFLCEAIETVGRV